MKRIALKIDVDTLTGTRIGAPALAELLHRHQAQGTFFFALGPDSSGRQAAVESLKSFYNLRTRLYGRLLPSPVIGKRCREALKKIQTSGFEAGLHAWSRVAWEEKIATAETTWINAEISRANTRFEEIFGEKPAAFAAPGWKSHRHALRLTQRLDYRYASNTRGSHPFIPVIEGEIVACPEIPTTLPTLDEVLKLDPALSVEQAFERILKLSQVIPGDHVFTLRAELEGMASAGAFEKLVSDWKSAGYQLVALRDLRADLEIDLLPRHTVQFAEIPGRPGKRLIQGPAYPLEG